MGYIYRITNKVSHKVYVGKTLFPDPESRWKLHKYMFKKEKGGCPALRDAVRKYGIDTFVFEVLIICFDEDCDRWEKEYIKKYNCLVPNGYNILEGGQGGAGFRGKKHTPESMKKILAALRARATNPEYVERARANGIRQMANVDRKEHGKKVRCSEKYQKAITDGRIGGRAHKEGTLSLETKEKIRSSALKYYEEKREGNKCNIEKHREAMAKSKGKKVDQYDKDGYFIKTHDSISEAAREVNVTKAAIQFMLRGKNKTAGGFVWKYHIEPHGVIVNEITYDS